MNLKTGEGTGCLLVTLISQYNVLETLAKDKPCVLELNGLQQGLWQHISQDT